MNEGIHRRIVGATYIAALLLSAALAVVGVGAMVVASEPGTGFVPSPGFALLAAYLIAPLAVALLSLGRSPRRATGVRKLILAGLAADIPAAAVLIVALGSIGQSWLLFLVIGAVGVVLLLAPSGRCFDAARALARGDATRAVHATRLTPYVIGIPAAIAAGLAAPVAFSGLPPCELCLQALLAVVVLAGYAVPALVAALLAASARRWLALADGA